MATLKSSETRKAEIRANVMRDVDGMGFDSDELLAHSPNDPLSSVSRGVLLFEL